MVGLAICSCTLLLLVLLASGWRVAQSLTDIPLVRVEAPDFDDVDDGYSKEEFTFTPEANSQEQLHTLSAVSQIAGMNESKVTGGKPVSRGYSYNALVQVVDRSRAEVIFYGSGFLIANHRVMTVAHNCYDEKTRSTYPLGSFSILVGAHSLAGDGFTYNVQGGEEAVRVKVERVQIYNNYFPTSLLKRRKGGYAHIRFDVCLIMLSQAPKDVQALQHIAPAVLGYESTPPIKVPHGSQVSVVGWGQIYEVRHRNTNVGETSDNSLSTPSKLHLISSTTTQCNGLIGTWDDQDYQDAPELLCIEAEHKQIQNGDSGGPLIFNHWGHVCGVSVATMEWDDAMPTVSMFLSILDPTLRNWIDSVGLLQRSLPGRPTVKNSILPSVELLTRLTQATYDVEKFNPEDVEDILHFLHYQAGELVNFLLEGHPLFHWSVTVHWFETITASEDRSPKTVEYAPGALMGHYTNLPDCNTDNFPAIPEGCIRTGGSISVKFAINGCGMQYRFFYTPITAAPLPEDVLGAWRYTVNSAVQRCLREYGVSEAWPVVDLSWLAHCTMHVMHQLRNGAAIPSAVWIAPLRHSVAQVGHQPTTVPVVVVVELDLDPEDQQMQFTVLLQH